MRLMELAGVYERFIFPPDASTFSLGMTGAWFSSGLPYDSVASLLESAFTSSDISVVVSGWVHVVVHPEEDMKVTMERIASRVAAGEQVVIPAQKTERFFYVTELAVVKEAGAGPSRKMPRTSEGGM